MDRVYGLLSKKFDTETVNELLHVSKNDLDETVAEFVDETKGAQQKFEDLVYEKVHGIEKIGLRLIDDHERTKNILASFAEERHNQMDDQAKWVKTVIHQVRQDTKADNTEILKDLDQISATIQDLMHGKSDKSELTELQSVIMRQLKSKAEISEVQEATTEQQKDIAYALNELKDELKGMILRSDEQFQAAISKRATQTDLESVAKTRLETKQFELFAKDAVTVENLQSVSDELYQMTQHVKSLVRQEDHEAQTHQTHNALEDMSKELLLKSNIKDMCSLLDMKVNIEDVNRVFMEFNKELEVKAGASVVASHIEEQKLVNEILCAENCTGRWLWKTGELGVGRAVPWGVQATNTCPDNFIWEQGRTSIVAVAPGLYEVALAFYCEQTPTIQIAVNGEPIINANAETANAKNIQPRDSQMSINAGNIAGLSLVDFIQLPTRSRISITYAGSTSGTEGFLGLRKL